MNNRSAVRTIGLATGTVVLLIVLFLVAGISTGFLPWRESYADGTAPSPEVDVLAPAPTASIGDAEQLTPEPTPTATPTPTPTPEVTPETDAEPTPIPTPTPVPSPTPDGTLDEELPTYTVTVTFSRGGTAIPYGNNTVVENGEITVVAVPNEGYTVDEMIIDGERLKNVSSYVFEDVTSDHSVYISFKRVLFDPNQQYGEEGAPPVAN